MKKIILVYIVLINVFTLSLAHSGRTDSNGGHWDHSTGEYHYHNGGSIQLKYEEDSKETKAYEKVEQTEKTTQLTDYSKTMEIIDEKDNEIERLKDDKKMLHFVYWFVIICMGIAIWNLSRENKK